MSLNRFPLESHESACLHYKINEYDKVWYNIDLLSMTYLNVVFPFQCLEREFVSQQLRKINCTPPWMTPRRSLWCQSSQKVSKETRKSIGDFTMEITKGKANLGTCGPLCNKTW